MIDPAPPEEPAHPEKGQSPGTGAPPPPTHPQGLFEAFDALMVMTIGLVLVIAYYFLQWKLEKAVDSLYLAVLSSCGLALIAAPWGLAAACGESPRLTFRLLRLPGRQLLWLTLLALSLVLPVEYLGNLTTHLIPVPPEVEALRAEMLPASPLEWALAALALCLVVPLGEETVFRGLLQQAARGPLGGMTSAVLCGLLFAGLHFQPWFLGGFVLLGIALGLALETTGSLLAPLWIHSIYNGVALVALAIDPTGEGESLASGRWGAPLVLTSGILAAWAWRALRQTHGWDDEDDHVDVVA